MDRSASVCVVVVYALMYLIENKQWGRGRKDIKCISWEKKAKNFTSIVANRVQSFVMIISF